MRRSGQLPQNCIVRNGLPAFLQQIKIFNIPFRAFYWRIIRLQDAKTVFNRIPRNAAQNLQMDFRVLDDPFFADIPFAGFKLGLNQHNRLRVRRKDFLHDRQNIRKGDK